MTATLIEIVSIYDSYLDWNRILLKITDVLSSRELLFYSKETTVHKGKCFCVVVVLFVYFGIYAVEFLKYLTKLYIHRTIIVVEVQSCTNRGNITEKSFSLQPIFVALGLKIFNLPHSLKKVKTETSWTKSRCSLLFGCRMSLWRYKFV